MTTDTAGTEHRVPEGTGGSLDDPTVWRRIRELFLLDPSTVHLDTATVGSPPRAALDRLGVADRELARVPRDPYDDSALVDVRTVLAGGYGCAPDEICVAGSAIDANTRVLNGLELAEGDEIVSTDHECFTIRTPLNALVNRRGVVVRRAALRVGPEQRAEDIVAAFAAAIGPRTRVLQWPAVSLTTGTVFPSRLLAELAHRHGLVSVVDGAQLAGQLELDLHALGVDFLTGSGAKFQCGPQGTAFVYARNRVLPRHNPLPLPAFWPAPSLAYPAQGGLPPRTTTTEPAYDLADLMQRADTVDLSRAAALRLSCQLWDRIGRAEIGRYVRALGDRLLSGVAEHFGTAALYNSVEDARLRCGMIAFTPFPEAADGPAEMARYGEFAARLRDEYRIVTSVTGFATPNNSGMRFAIRVSPHLYNTYDEIDSAVAAMAALASRVS
ncbi:aminotransferase class V-fold PLP-dependent enzyme [Polymorphospora lycopeni]|uniref:Aminotransferase class V-fold PLP-dependent enzyme n=1 Tax=Polymorphospora lycopeni TaxID=3140240 RepID=A0ABV5CXE3_9ACTN